MYFGGRAQVKNFDTLNIKIMQEPDGLRLSQNGRSYKASKWIGSREVKDVFELAFSADLTCIWQFNHPSDSKLYETGESVDYISFSRAHDLYWVFALDMDSCPSGSPRDKPQRLKFKKIYRHILRAHGISCKPEWRSPQNLHVDLYDLPQALKAIAGHVTDLSRMTGKKLRRGNPYGFADEDELHGFLLTNWAKIELFKDLDKIAKRNLGGPVGGRDGELDILAQHKFSGDIYVIELKDSAQASANHTVVDQLSRYMSHPEIASMCERETKVHGWVIAQDIDFKSAQAIRKSSLPITAFEIQKDGDMVNFETVASSENQVF